ncbi:MAG: GYD domain-containing protein [Pyrinomonadaceae bacterium]|nr:GYD domain-containing protein [Pyrinomonadaceae bacterium]
MAYYMLQGAYSTDAWESLVSNPVNRVEAIRPAIENLGGHIENAWFAFGEYDVVLIMQMPDNLNAAAFAFAIAAGGAFKTHKTTPLMSIDEGVEAMRRASDTGYSPPRS